jgi:hypothetical protein
VLRVAIEVFCPREQSARSSDSNASPLSLAGLHTKRYPAAVSFDIRQESRYVSRPPDHAGVPSLDPFTPLGDVGVMLPTRDTQVQSPLAYGLHNTPGGEFEQTHIPRRLGCSAHSKETRATICVDASRQMPSQTDCPESACKARPLKMTLA